MTSIAGDFSEWWHKTPGNNEMSNQSFNDIHRNLFACKGSGWPLLQYIEKWYFYKGFVIGTIEPNQPNQFFIINEQACTLDTFNSDVEFDQYLIQKRLKPILWTRWYNSNWGFIFVGRGYGGYWDFLFFRGTWLLLPLLVLAVFWIFKYASKRNLKWIFSLVYIILMLIRITLDIIPVSV
jgi:hypothetical protein